MSGNGEAMKLTFPLYLVLDPQPDDENAASICWTFHDFAQLEANLNGGRQLGDPLRGRNPVLYTDKGEALDDAEERFAARDGAKVPEWIALRDLRSGAVFEAQAGYRGVKTTEEYVLDVWVCIDLGNGARFNGDGGEIVKEIL